MEIELRTKCFVKDCNERVPLHEFFNLRYNYLLCKNHNKIFHERFKDKTDYHEKEIRIYKEIGVDLDRLRKHALEINKNIKSEFPALFK